MQTKSDSDLLSGRRLSDQIRIIRVSRRMTQRELAAKTGLHAQTLSQIETGTRANVTIQTALRILDALDADLVVRPRLSEAK